MVLTRRRGLLPALAFLAIAGAASAQVAGGSREKQPQKTFGAQSGQPFMKLAEQSGGLRPLLFGFALECTRCEPTSRRGGFSQGFRGGPLAVWHYDEFPRVAAVVEGSPAEGAGIRLGDLLLDVDGMSLLTSEGAERFSALRAGDTVKLSLERAGKPYGATLVLGRPPGFGRGGGLRLTPQPSRFTTRVGPTTVEVSSDQPVVSSTDSSGTTTLRIGATTIRLRPTPAKAP